MDVMTAIRTRRSVRSYAARPIPADVLERMQQALRYAPSACNYQPWRFIMVTDADLKQKVAQASFDQMWMAAAPVIVVGCGDLTHAYKTMGGRGNSTDIDLAIALDHLSLAAVAEGLGTCWIGAFDEQRVKELLDVPTEIKVVAMMPLGYPATPDLNFPLDDTQRKPPGDVFHKEHYGEA
ncbi:MAG: nitroreductase family protein [Planctomycetes bacterium]|nr:nitroreductase family protein [Planctomycetota bacterium]